MSADIGKIFEKQLERQVLEPLNKARLVEWHRFVDSHTAGNIVLPQPSDYLLGLPPGSSTLKGCNQRVVFFEAKASDKHETLQKSAVSSDQRGAIQRWRMLLDVPYLVIFYSAAANAVEIWDGKSIIEGSRLKKDSRLVRVEKAGAGRRINEFVFGETLIDFFNIPKAAETVRRYRKRHPEIDEL